MALRQLALLALAGFAAAVTDMQDGCVHMQIVHSTNANYFTKRAVELSLSNRSDVAYYAKLSFGTPPQPQFVQLDTGSFELWVNPTCSGLSTSDSTFCKAIGHFDTTASTTLTALNSAKQLRYGIGIANISYVRDNITLPGTSSTLDQVQFGVATSTADEFSGILGIGYGYGLTTRYPNFVDELARQNITKVKAFSLALGSKDEQEGVIVFGGVDTSKFTGTLARLPITPAKYSPDGVPRYWVNMTSLSLTTAATTTSSSSSSSSSAATHTYANSKMQVFLDSGSTLTLLPSALADAIGADFGVTGGADANGFYAVDCAYAEAAGSLNFAFDGVTIQVPFNELIRKSGSACMLGIQSNTDFVLLGDTFLRSAYVVIDQTDNVVWMSQYVNCGSTPAALASSSSLTGLTGACKVETVSDSSSSSSSSSSSASSPSPSSSPTTTSPSRLATSTAASPSSGSSSGSGISGGGGGSGSGSSSSASASASAASASDAASATSAASAFSSPGQWLLPAALVVAAAWNCLL